MTPTPMRQKIDTAVSVAAGVPHRPYQIMSKQDLADLLILNKLAEEDALSGKLVPKAKDLVKRWLDDAWLSIVWEARHAGFKPEEAQKVISDDGLKAAEYLYNTKEFQPMFGGLKWATISANTRRAFQSWESGAARAMLADMVNALYTEHNTGLFGEKLMQPAAKLAVKDARDPYYGGLGSLLKSASKDVQAAAKGLIEEPKFVEPELDDDDFLASYQKKYPSTLTGGQEPWRPEPLSKKPETKSPKRGPKSRPWWNEPQLGDWK